MLDLLAVRSIHSTQHITALLCALSLTANSNARCFHSYEQWHPELDDFILRPMGMPRFALKLYVPRLTIIDVLLMYADLQVRCLSPQKLHSASRYLFAVLTIPPLC